MPVTYPRQPLFLNIEQKTFQAGSISSVRGKYDRIA